MNLRSIKPGQLWSRRSFWVGILTLLFLLGTYTPALQWFETRFFDAAARLMPEGSPSDSVVVIAIDEAAEGEYGSWPWSRARLAEVVTALEVEGARAVGLLVALDQPETPLALEEVRREIEEGQDALIKRRTELRSERRTRARDESLERVRVGLDKLETASYWLGRVDTDRKLVWAVRTQGGVVIPAQYAAVAGERGATAGLPAAAVEPATKWYLSGWLTPLWSAPDTLGAVSLREPLEGYARQARAIGAPPVWDDDARVRGMPLLVPQGEAWVPSFALALVAVANNVAPAEAVGLGGFGVRLGDAEMATGPRYQFYPLPAVMKDELPSVTTYSAVDLLEGKVAAGTLRDKVVLVGPTAPGARARLRVPEHMLDGSRRDRSAGGHHSGQTRES